MWALTSLTPGQFKHIGSVSSPETTSDQTSIVVIYLLSLLVHTSHYWQAAKHSLHLSVPPCYSHDDIHSGNKSCEAKIRYLCSVYFCCSERGAWFPVLIFGSFDHHWHIFLIKQSTSLQMFSQISLTDVFTYISYHLNPSAIFEPLLSNPATGACVPPTVRAVPELWRPPAPLHLAVPAWAGVGIPAHHGKQGSTKQWLHRGPSPGHL